MKWEFVDAGDIGGEERLCSKPNGGGNFLCPKGYFCGKPNDRNLTLTVDDPVNQELIMYGIVTFDNIIYAFITIIQMITLEGWSFIMYNLMDATGSDAYGLEAVIFCVLIVFIGGFFFLNNLP